MNEQAREALAKADAIRLARTRERRELKDAPMAEVIAALVNPSPALGTYRIRELLGNRRGGSTRLIPRFRSASLNAALGELAIDRPHGRRWHSDLRLDELTEEERRRLVRGVVKRAPKAWREAA